MDVMYQRPLVAVSNGSRRNMVAVPRVALRALPPLSNKVVSGWLG